MDENNNGAVAQESGEPPVIGEVRIRLHANGDLHIAHPQDMVLFLGMLELAKVQMAANMAAGRLAQAAKQEAARVVPANGPLPANLPPDLFRNRLRG